MQRLALAIIISPLCLVVPHGPARAATTDTKPGSSFFDCTDGKCPEMIVIPAGSNVMGSTETERQQQGVSTTFGEREDPRHTVTFGKPFAMAKTHVTRGLYATFVAETKLSDPKDCAVHDNTADTWGSKPGFNWHNPGFAQTDKDPVVCVSFHDAEKFAAWLSKRTSKHYRLPSEAEFEYAARGGTTTARWWGDSPESLCNKVNIMTTATAQKFGSPDSWSDRLMCNADHSFTQPVGSYDPNPYGLDDMIGNAWEWVSDCFNETFKGAPTDGSAWTTGDCSKRLVTGGAYHSAPYLARAATRGAGLGMDEHVFAAGFRVARDVD